ncbi:hypothetical protein [Mucilaginibacter ginsenosidivorax]|uniref:O-antigen ligase family protein n=1 Tax=Mucilaginibacter ginsenosidivorax TaxID=862126 RepID=A0A5B8W820_9SPHI|nr:hypothetical protein [Mucilaginibacter ginsenosidivorax]QEC80064.1 hypothetical protein FSB76_30450 [Mucilaginibacter ginsenosidivorax]
MLVNKAIFYINKLKQKVDWKLLAFLLLFLNVKIGIKIPVILLFTLLQFNFKFGFRFKNSRLPLFYPLVIAIAVINWFIGKNYTQLNYTVMLLAGIGFWILCILAIHQVKLAVEQNQPAVIHQTIFIFFVINALFSAGNLVAIFLETHTINPYTYQGQLQKYFLNTGDYIRGVTFDTSTTNAMLNAFGVIYFLTRKNAIMLFVCMATLLFTGSNFINIVIVLVFLLLFVFKTDRYQKSLIVICLVFLGVFMAKISPQNNQYTANAISILLHKDPSPPKPSVWANVPVNGRPDNVLSFDERRQKQAIIFRDSIYKATHPQKTVIIKPQSKPYETEGGRIAIKGPDINSAPYQSSTQTPPEQKQLVQFIDEHKAALPVAGQEIVAPRQDRPGKLIGFLQTTSFLHHHINKIITGTGIGNFSSKLAFRATGLGFAGGYPHKFTYIGHDFMVNHLDLYLNYFSKRAGFHSLTNSPFSVYDQLLAEYGLIGLIIFAVYYLGFFARHYKALTYGLPLLLLMLAAFFIEYWFEQLSVIVFFELLLLLNIKESQSPKPLANEF